MEIEPNNVKALYRQAKAHIGLQDFELAIQDLLKAKEIEPDDRTVNSESSKVKCILQSVNQKKDREKDRETGNERERKRETEKEKDRQESQTKIKN